MTTNDNQTKHILTLLESINTRLGVAISLHLRVAQKDKTTTSLKDQVDTLDDLGLRPRDIAEILGRKPKHIGKELAGIRKERKKHAKKNET